ncbi:MAG TPA: alpha/beta hydrolase [Candidatus Nitrosotalea sp.]|nr:alpha/beta hydrolase [Candidatus Nitrosotalea sp.]
MPSYLSRGYSLHYEEAGQKTGPAVVLIHGFASDAGLNWRGTAWITALVRAGYRVLAPDCLGHGQSDKPHLAADYDRVQMAADAALLLEQLAPAGAALIGYSMGGQIGLRLALSRPDLIHRCVIGGWDESQRLSVAAVARRLRGEPGGGGQEEEFLSFAAARPVNDLLALAACIEGPAEPLALAELASIQAPTLVATGDADHLAPEAATLARRLVNARHLSLAGRDHMSALTAGAFRLAALEFLAEP